MAQKHLEPGTKMNLAPLGVALGDARTTAVVKGRQLEVVRIVLLAGKRMKEHKVSGEMTVHCLEGRVEFQAQQTLYVLEAGDFIHLAGGTPHALHALMDSSALVTISIGSV